MKVTEYPRVSADSGATSSGGAGSHPNRREANIVVGPTADDGIDGDPIARQHVSEPKAFTGRGRAGDALVIEERRLRAAIDQTHAAIEHLGAQTRHVRGRRFYLMVQKRRQTGAMFLRWRDTGAGGGHVPWHKVPEFIAREPMSLHDWYARINAHAMELNDEEQIRRLALALFLRRQARLRIENSRDHASVSGAKREPLTDR